MRLENPYEKKPARPFPFALLLGLSSLTVALAANISVYTPLESGKCKNLKTDTSGAGYVQDLCPGTAGYSLMLEEGDLRQNLTVVPPKGEGTSLALWTVVGSSFSSLGPRAEWRLRGKTPTALIVRYNLSNPEDSSKITSWLAVAKLGAKPCVVAKVKPGANQNVQARSIADRAAGMPCLPSS